LENSYYGKNHSARNHWYYNLWIVKLLKIYIIVQEFLISNGLPALFILSFLAATIIPLGSEWLLVVLLLNNRDPIEIVAVASIGNYLGACTTYLIGIWGSSFLVQHVLRVDNRDLIKAESLYNKYGCYSLLLSWLPIIGDPLCLIGGFFKVNFLLFSFLVFSGKLARYTTLAFVTIKAMA